MMILHMTWIWKELSLLFMRRHSDYDWTNLNEQRDNNERDYDDHLLIETISEDGKTTLRRYIHVCLKKEKKKCSFCPDLIHVRVDRGGIFWTVGVKWLEVVIWVLNTACWGNLYTQKVISDKAIWWQSHYIKGYIRRGEGLEVSVAMDTTTLKYK